MIYLLGISAGTFSVSFYLALRSIQSYEVWLSLISLVWVAIGSSKLPIVKLYTHHRQPDAARRNPTIGTRVLKTVAKGAVTFRWDQSGKLDVSSARDRVFPSCLTCTAWWRLKGFVYL